MAGARIGYAVAAEQTIRAFDKVRLHFGVSLLAQAGALASLADPTSSAASSRRSRRGRATTRRLANRSVCPAPSATNFVAFDTGSPVRARALWRRWPRGSLCPHARRPPLDRLLRVTVGTRSSAWRSPWNFAPWSRRRAKHVTTHSTPFVQMRPAARADARRAPPPRRRSRAAHPAIRVPADAEIRAVRRDSAPRRRNAGDRRLRRTCRRTLFRHGRSPSGRG